MHEKIRPIVVQLPTGEWTLLTAFLRNRYGQLALEAAGVDELHPSRESAQSAAEAMEHWLQKGAGKRKRSTALAREEERLAAYAALNRASAPEPTLRN